MIPSVALNCIDEFTFVYMSDFTRIGTLNNFGYQNEDIRIVFVDVPSFVADKQKAKTNRFNTANAETLVTMGSKLEAEGFPTPIVYDNTDVAKKIDFNEFKKGYRE